MWINSHVPLARVKHEWGKKINGAHGLGRATGNYVRLLANDVSAKLKHLLRGLRMHGRLRTVSGQETTIASAFLPCLLLFLLISLDKRK